MKIDFHTHILPCMDDGAKSVEESLAMLRSLKEQGVDTVVFTPHYYSQREPIDKFLKRREHALSKLIQTDALHDLTYHVGAEVHYSDYLFNNDDLAMLCIDDTDTMLLELPYNKTIDSNLLDRVWQLMCEYGVTPVIAHVERYPVLWRSKKYLDNLLSMGCVLQVNLSSADHFGKRRLISRINEGYIGALGTDAHNMGSRPPAYDNGYFTLQKSVPMDILDRIHSTMASLLE